jgi:cell wall-associated NlpC family hydrolase
MLRTRILLLLLFVLAAGFVALVRPLPGRADNGDPAAPPPPPDPSNTDPVVPALPVVKVAPVRKPASFKRLNVSLGDKIVKYATRMVGVPYSYGGSTPRGFDCSGLTSYVYRHFGISVARTSYSQFREGMRVARNGLKPGDLVFFHGLGHVGIYIGDGRFIHAPHAGTRVRIESMSGWYASRFDGARRLIRRNA